MSAPKLVSYGRGSLNHWGQGRCAACDSWLKDMPDRHEVYYFTSTEPDSACSRCGGAGVVDGWSDPDRAPYEKGTPCECVREIQKRAYRYFWRCLSCGREREQADSAPPGNWTPDPDAKLHEPGTVPLGPVKEPREWRDGSELTDAQVKLARECWGMVDSLKTESPIHKVTYIWNLEEALVGQDIDAVVAAARSYVELLDYEAVHAKDSGTYYGAEGDLTSIRQHLAGIDRGD